MLDNMRISRRRLLTAMALSPLLLKMNTARAAAIDPLASKDPFQKYHVKPLANY